MEAIQHLERTLKPSDAKLAVVEEMKKQYQQLHASPYVRKDANPIEVLEEWARRKGAVYSKLEYKQVDVHTREVMAREAIHVG